MSDKLRFADLDIPTTIDLHNEPTPTIPFVVAPWLIKETYTVLSAQTSHMKSYFALWLAGKWSATGKPVLYIDRENGKAIILPRIKQMHIPAEGDFLYWGDWPSLKVPPPSRIYDPLIIQAVKDSKNLLLVLDNLDKFHDREENSNTEMKSVGSDIRKLVNMGATVLALQQNTKPDPQTQVSRSRGAGAIVGDSDVAFTITHFENLNKEEDGDTNPQNWLTFTCHKNRYLGFFQRQVVFDTQTGSFELLPRKGRAKAESVAKEYFNSQD